MTTTLTQPTKALSVKQPWASLIMFGFKDVENRSWATKRRGSIWIASTATPASPDLCPKDSNVGPLGVVLGSVEIVDCVQDSDSPWAIPGQWHWVLANPQPLRDPIPAKGRLGFWDFTREEG